MRNKTQYRIGSLERALLVLDTLAELPDASVAELAQLLGVAKGSLFRHLKVLEANDYVQQSPETKRYSLGPRLLYLGHAARAQSRLPEVAVPLMTALRDRFNETVHVGVLSRGEVVHVEVVPSTHPVKMAAEVGDRTWAHVSGLGKVLLAWGDDDAIESVLRERGLPALTERTIVDRATLDVELERVRSRGYAIDDEESAYGLRCVAAPVRDGRAVVVGALSLSSPAERLSLEAAEQAAAVVIATADAISRRLGWGGGSSEASSPSRRVARVRRRRKEVA
jgi:DNA-binding IclR family transcriptional regulator